MRFGKNGPLLRLSIRISPNGGIWTPFVRNRAISCGMYFNGQRWRNASAYSSMPSKTQNLFRQHRDSRNVPRHRRHHYRVPLYSLGKQFVTTTSLNRLCDHPICSSPRDLNQRHPQHADFHTIDLNQRSKQARGEGTIATCSNHTPARALL